MTPKLETFAEIVAQANDQFMDKHKLVNTLIGIMDKALRQQGMAADAITIDAVELNKKIVFLLRDLDDTSVEVALGNKAGDIHDTTQYQLADLDISMVINIMEESLIS
ncbi:hypothetical protein HII17_14080 [Thalassotalea sp. M1531]|uniref:Uncharacterized protein n=1 Tax=Thalassotalea algicola TaxID=2716224 RepID=A0A7Y0LFD5_9GAMM|nr:hypothetical protein [Thalassotalea algicola]NMP32686.1 hypothetical protein [Thalassotalea algicola]